MLREIINPANQDSMLHLPQKMVGKTVEFVAFEINEFKNPVSKAKRLAQIEVLTQKTLTDLSGFKFYRKEANNYA